MIKEELQAIDTVTDTMFDTVIQNMDAAFSYTLSSCKEDRTFAIDDDKVNEYERIVESLSLQLLLKETVYSQDFRRVSGILKLVESLERIGDNAYDIKGMADDLKRTNGKLLPGSEELFALAESMVKDSYKAFLTMNLSLAKSVLDRDSQADKRYWSLEMDLAKALDGKKESGENGIYLAHIYKYGERIGDQATNIAEWVIYIASGIHKNREII
ncbi:MAG: PhoU domain-containing protein [Bacilli bacterium]|jgi:phosphate transport system protein